MADETETNISGGHFAGPIISGGTMREVSGGTINIGNTPDELAELISLLTRLRDEIDTADGAPATKSAALTIVDQLADGAAPQQGQPDRGRLAGLFGGLKALVQPLTVSADLVTQIGRLIGG